MLFKRWMMIALLVLFVSVQTSSAQQVTPEATVNPDLAAQMSGLEQITQNLRGLTLKQPIMHRFPTRQQTIAYLQASYAREFPPEKFDQLKLFYVALGLLSPDVDLQKVYLSLLDSQVAGYYDPDTKTMNVIVADNAPPNSTLSFTDQIIYVHEFTHALQDQYFDLNQMLSPAVEADPDHSLAVTSLVEGDATATMTLYAEAVETRNPLAAIGLLVEGIQAGNLTLPPGVPPILTNELLFPYTDGLNFILALNKSGGWPAINAAFKNPPTTSAQILHPEKYLAGVGAQPIALADQSALLGAGWKSEWESGVGEFYLREALATQLSATDAAASVAGWGGDHLRVYRDDASGQTASVLKITWDTPAAAQDFTKSYFIYGNQRFASALGSDNCWPSADSAVCIGMSATQSLIVTAPTLAQAKALRESS